MFVAKSRLTSGVHRPNAIVYSAGATKNIYEFTNVSIATGGTLPRQHYGRAKINDPVKGETNMANSITTRREGPKVGESYHEYIAQVEFANLLFKALEISWSNPIRKVSALWAASEFKEVHKKCCEWANEDI